MQKRTYTTALVCVATLMASTFAYASDAPRTLVRIEVERAGVAFDAISVTTPDGVEHFATHLDDFQVDGFLSYPESLLGEPEGTCGHIVDLGKSAGSYVTLAFPVHSAMFTKGASITVYSNTTECEQPPSEVEGNAYTVSVSEDGVLFSEIATGVQGHHAIFGL